MIFIINSLFQLHLLVEDSRRLIETYPGGNEEHIQMQLALVIENWNSLQQKVATRKENLIAAQRIHRFITLVIHYFHFYLLTY